MLNVFQIYFQVSSLTWLIDSNPIVVVVVVLSLSDVLILKTSEPLAFNETLAVLLRNSILKRKSWPQCSSFAVFLLVSKLTLHFERV